MGLPLQQSVPPQVRIIWCGYCYAFEKIASLIWLTMVVFIQILHPLSNQPPSTKKNHTGLIVGIVVGFAVLSVLCVLVAIYIAQRRKRAQMNEGNIS